MILRAILIGLWFSVSALAFSQDTVIVSKQTKKIQNGLDSLTRLGSVSRLQDSLKISRWSDSLNARINKTFSPTTLTKQLDSLKRKGASLAKMDFYSDSLARKKEALLAEVATKQKSLQGGVTERYDGWLAKIRNRYNTDSAGLKMLSMPTALPATNLPNSNIPKMPGTDLPGIPSLNTSDFASLPMSSDLKQVGGAYTIPSNEQLNTMNLALPAYTNQLV